MEKVFKSGEIVTLDYRGTDMLHIILSHDLCNCCYYAFAIQLVEDDDEADVIGIIEVDANDLHRRGRVVKSSELNGRCGIFVDRYLRNKGL